MTNIQQLFFKLQKKVLQNLKTAIRKVVRHDGVVPFMRGNVRLYTLYESTIPTIAQNKSLTNQALEMIQNEEWILTYDAPQTVRDKLNEIAEGSRIPDDCEGICKYRAEDIATEVIAIYILFPSDPNPRPPGLYLTYFNRFTSDETEEDALYTFWVH